MLREGVWRTRLSQELVDRAGSEACEFALQGQWRGFGAPGPGRKRGFELS